MPPAFVPSHGLYTNKTGRACLWVCCSTMGMLQLVLLTLGGAGSSIRNGAPPSAPAGFDCALAQLQLEFARQQQPFRQASDFQALADALQLGVGGCSPAAASAGGAGGRGPADTDPYQGAGLQLVAVDCGAGDDRAGDGQAGAPLRSLPAAVLAARKLHGPATLTRNHPVGRLWCLHLSDRLLVTTG